MSDQSSPSNLNSGDGVTEPLDQPVKHRRWSNLVEPLALLGPAGFWLVLLLMLPTLIIFELSLVPGFRPGM